MTSFSMDSTESEQHEWYQEDDVSDDSLALQDARL